MLIRDIKTDLFSSIVMGNISKIKTRFPQYAKIIIISKHNQVQDLWPLVGSSGRESLVV